MRLRNLARKWYVLIAVVALAFSIVCIGLDASLLRVQRENPTYAMEKHAPLSISSVEDLTHPEDSTGCRCVRGGTGTRDDPFIIGWWDIEASGGYGISVRGSGEEGLGVYVKLTNLRIAGANGRIHIGIALDRMTNSEIENSTIIDSEIAVSLYASDHNQMSQLNVQRSTTGVKLESSGDSSLLSSNFSSCGVAVWIRGPSNRVIQNKITACTAGVNVDGDGGRSANDNVIEGNTITDGGPEAYGIALYRADNNVISGNTVARMGWGIAIAEPSNGNTISHNMVLQNERSGIFVCSSSSGNTVTLNTAKGNGDGISSFDLHEENDLGVNAWRNNQFNTRNRDDLG